MLGRSLLRNLDRCDHLVSQYHMINGRRVSLRILPSLMVLSSMIILVALMGFSVSGSDSYEKELLIREITVLNTLRIGIINTHEGIHTSLITILDTVGTHILESVPLNGMTHGVKKNEANNWWRNNRHICEGKYDGLIVADTASLARPLLQNHCAKPIVILITNRYDYAEEDDREYHALMEESCLRPNVLCVATNRLEALYAARVRRTYLWIQAILPLGAFLPEALSDILGEAEIEIKADDKSWLVHPSGPLYDLYLKPELDKLGITLKPIIPGRFGGPLAIHNHTVVHVPHQPTTISFWENLASGVDYVVPDIQLYRSWMTSFFGMDGQVFTEEDMSRVMDWYRPEHREFICYFSSVDQLREDSTFAVECLSGRDERQKKIQEFMNQHRRSTTKRWTEILTWMKTNHFPSPEKETL
ncbi:hypothetical protein PROFUN_08532 [Planoprotostelium fungivorum]|uniref:Uncharacterized protein n=1 Tax=Planoprotostelium fungivorum TaxID=1890364 RepID=A0A2P6N1L3_9EUKA|nr:hypothetical protein PROFUN_08532 [Planoprotostelium fungivorum]